MSGEDVVRFVFVKDPHFDFEGTPARRDNYLEAVLSKFDQVAKICHSISADALLIPGDVFLKFSPTTIKHELVGVVSECFRNIPCPVAGIVGNHDSQRGIQHLSNYPINTLIKSGVYQHVEDDPLFIEKSGIKVKVGGASYHKEAYSKIMQYPKGEEDFLVLLAHFFLGTNKGDFFGERVYGMNEFTTAEFDVLAVGHEHINHGVFSKYGKHFINSGQMVRVTAAQSDKDLVPQVVVFSLSKTNGFKSTIVPIDCAPAEQIFAVPEKYGWQEKVADFSDLREKLASEKAWASNRGTASDPTQLLESYRLAKGEDWGVSDTVYQKTVQYLGGS